jgi:hypothetical protein
VLPLLAFVLAALMLPAAAEAKITCAEPLRPEPDPPFLSGVPDDPVAGKTYRITIRLRADVGVNAVPYLGAEYCGDGVPRDSMSGAGGWFRQRGADVYIVDLRFPSPGPWAVSYMDKHGWFHELDLPPVRGLPSLSLEQAVWIFQPDVASSRRSRALFPARVRTSGS